MTEPDKLAKMIAHRQKQEKKNDMLRVHKNKIENDRLLVQVSYLDWNKELREREMGSKENEFLRRLEKIYDRQLSIEEERIKEKEKARKEKEAKKRRRQLELAAAELGLKSAELASEMMEKERRRQLNSTKQEWGRTFMNKAKSLSGGYRDNDPPQIYYKRKGIVPPDRTFTPEVSAEAQASFGGGSRPPSSSDHLFRSNLPQETPYGIIDTFSKRSGSSIRSTRTNSARSGYSNNITMSSDEEDDDISDSAVINEVIKVNVRPSTAPMKRQHSTKSEPRDGILVTHQVKQSVYNGETNDEQEELVQNVAIEAPIQKLLRPSTASATVRFNGNLQDVERITKSSLPSNRRRASLRTPNLLMFHRRPSNAATLSGSSSTPSSPRRPKGRDATQQAMSNAEQERIKRKMQEKADCLRAERMKRVLMQTTPTKLYQPRLHSATTSREMPFLEHFMKNKSHYLQKNAPPIISPQNKVKSTKETDAMMDYIEQIENGIALADNYQAKKVLLEANHERREELLLNVREFVR